MIFKVLYIVYFTCGIEVRGHTVEGQRSCGSRSKATNTKVKCHMGHDQIRILNKGRWAHNNVKLLHLSFVPIRTTCSVNQVTHTNTERDKFMFSTADKGSKNIRPLFRSCSFGEYMHRNKKNQLLFLK